MVRKSEIRSGLAAAVVWLAIQISTEGIGYAGLLDDLCHTSRDPAQVIEPLVEELEATGIPPATLNRLLVVGYQNAAAVADLKGIMCIIVVSEENGLPPEPLFEKLEEGLGKRVPLDRIQSAIMGQVEKLRYAQSIVSQGKPPVIDDPNVLRIAALMDVGMSRADLERLFGPDYTATTDMRVVAAEILGYGGVAGIPREHLEQVVAAGLASGALTPEWSFYIKVVNEARKQGIPDEKTTTTAIAVLTEKKSMDALIKDLGLKKKRVYSGSSS